MKRILSMVLMFSLTVSCNKDGGSSASIEGLNQGPEGAIDQPSTPLPSDETPSDSTARTWNEEFMDLINAHRTAQGLRMLLDEVNIGEIARTHSANMAKGSVAFGHDGFSARCSEAYAAMGGGSACGENVAYGQTSPQKVFQSWLNSPGHRANIENSKYTHSGFGYVKNSSGRIYWTHIFIRK